MEESSSSNSSPNSGENLVNHSENVEEAQSHSVSPERSTVETESIVSPILNETNMEARLLNVEESADNEERSNNRENVIDGYLDPEEVRMQRHVMLNSAMVSQESESAFNCKYPGCNYTSTDVEMFLKHEDTHIDGGSMVCDVCNTRFATYANMRRHRLLHLGIRPFECQICTKRFLRKEQFMEHLLRHSKPRPFRCPFCSKSFGFRPHLKAHLTTDHTNVAIDKTCRLCDFKASSPNGAKIHFAMCHLKQTLDVNDAVERSQEIIGSSQAHVNPTENGAIDLATVSQNFSFIQAAHYSPYSTSVSDSSAVVPGPSDLSHTSKIHLVTSATGPRALIPHAEQSIVLPVAEEDNRHTCISALAGSTTMVSPVACQDRMCCRSSQPHQELPSRDRVCVKPEPPELSVDDSSQNSNVQPTSTMDLSTTDVVETTCVSTEASGSSEMPCRRKAHKRSSSDETGSESHNSPPNRVHDSQNMPQGSRSTHTCYRIRHCEESSSSQRCREFQRHTCIAHRHSTDKRPRMSESDGDRNVQDHSDGEERKVFYNRATSTNTLTPAEVPGPRVIHHASTLHADGSCTSASHPEPSYFGRKSTILIRDIESCTLTCPYCGIIFPDQTLYFLHRSLHSESSPWKCNLCGKTCKDKYDFNSHVISKNHY